MIEENAPDVFPTSPAWRVTDSCLAYMMKRTEFREFNSNYHDLAKRAVESEEDPEKSQALYKKYRSFRQYFLESFLCRMTDFLVQYLEDVLFEALVKSDNLIIDADWQRFEKEIDDLEDTSEKRIRLADLIVERLAGPRHVGELCSFMRKRIGITVMPDDDEKRYALVLSALRNLIVHNDGNPNNRFLRKISGLGFEVNLRPDGRVHIDEAWLTQRAIFIDRIIFGYDFSLVETLGLDVRDRRGVFWIRSFSD